jgi:hypothetical protein
MLLVLLGRCVCRWNPVDLGDVAVQLDIGVCSDVAGHIYPGCRSPNGKWRVGNDKTVTRRGYHWPYLRSNAVRHWAHDLRDVEGTVVDVEWDV